MVRRIIRVLEQRQASPRFWVTLPYSARRLHLGQRFFLDNGEEVEFDCPYSSFLTPGQQLETEHGDIVEVIGEEEQVSVAVLRHVHPLLFARACYILGIFRMPMELGRDWVRYPVNSQVDDKLIELGLEVHREKAVFCPERDAFLFQAMREATGYPNSIVTSNSSSRAEEYIQDYIPPPQTAGPFDTPFESTTVANEYPYQGNYVSDPYVSTQYIQAAPEYSNGEYIVQDPYVSDPNYGQYLPPQSNTGGFFRRLLDEL